MPTALHSFRFHQRIRHWRLPLAAGPLQGRDCRRRSRGQLPCRRLAAKDWQGQGCTGQRSLRWHFVLGNRRRRKGAMIMRVLMRLEGRIALSNGCTAMKWPGLEAGSIYELIMIACARQQRKYPALKCALSLSLALGSQCNCCAPTYAHLLPNTSHPPISYPEPSLWPWPLFKDKTLQAMWASP